MRSYSAVTGVSYWPVLLVCLICSAAAAIVAVSEQDYLPMHQGDEWVMDMVIMSPAGEKFTGTGHRRVGEQVERDGKTYYQVRTWMENGPFPFDQSKLMRKDETGVYSIDPQSKDQKEQHEILLPLKAGQHWVRTDGSRTLRESIIGMEPVTVGGKTYDNCFHIRSQAEDGSLTEDFWEAPLVGCIKSETRGSGAIFNLTFREFKSGKP